MGERTINWTNAPVVPLAILQARDKGEFFPGKIVKGPYGQLAYFASGGPEEAPKSNLGSVKPGDGTYGDVGN